MHRWQEKKESVSPGKILEVASRFSGNLRGTECLIQKGNSHRPADSLHYFCFSCWEFALSGRILLPVGYVQVRNIKPLCRGREDKTQLVYFWNSPGNDPHGSVRRRFWCHPALCENCTMTSAHQDFVPSTWGNEGAVLWWHFFSSPDFLYEAFTLCIRIKINNSHLNEELIQVLSLLPKPGPDNWKVCCCFSPWWSSSFHAIKWFIVLRWCTKFIFKRHCCFFCFSN